MSKKNINRLNEIIKNFHDGNKEESYNNLKDYIKIYPNDLVALYNFAYMSEVLNKLEVAIKNYVFIINQDKNHWQSRFNLYLIFINTFR